MSRRPPLPNSERESRFESMSGEVRKPAQKPGRVERFAEWLGAWFRSPQGTPLPPYRDKD